MMRQGKECDCNVEKLEAVDAAAPDRVENVVLRVSGMGCVNCANRVYNGLVAANGVLSATVDLASGTATVRIDPERIRSDVLPGLVAQAGAAGRHRYQAVVLPAA